MVTLLPAIDNLIYWGKAYGLRGSELASRVRDVLDHIGQARPGQADRLDHGRHAQTDKFSFRCGVGYPAINSTACRDRCYRDAGREALSVPVISITALQNRQQRFRALQSAFVRVNQLELHTSTFGKPCDQVRRVAQPFCGFNQSINLLIANRYVGSLVGRHIAHFVLHPDVLIVA